MAVLAGGLIVVPTLRADIVGFKNGAHWRLNHAVNGSGNPPVIAGSTCQLTDDNSDEHNTVFYDRNQSITAFVVTFTYQCSGNRAGDGATFCLQNDPRCEYSVGDKDGSLGYQGIQNSVAIALNLFNGHPGQTDVLFNPIAGIPRNPGDDYLDSSPVNITNGNPISVTLTYDGSTLTETLVDQVTNDTYTHSYRNLDIPTIVGDPTAVVGFTGGTNEATAVQTISDFTFIELW
jgi:hypothetical protein